MMIIHRSWREEPWPQTATAGWSKANWCMLQWQRPLPPPPPPTPLLLWATVLYAASVCPSLSLATCSLLLYIIVMCVEHVAKYLPLRNNKLWTGHWISSHQQNYCEWMNVLVGLNTQRGEAWVIGDTLHAWMCMGNSEKCNWNKLLIECN